MFCSQKEKQGKEKNEQTERRNGCITITTGDFNTPSSAIGKISRHKIMKFLEHLDSNINHLDLKLTFLEHCTNNDRTNIIFKCTWNMDHDRPYAEL